jgi:hypothetical protein
MFLVNMVLKEYIEVDPVNRLNFLRSKSHDYADRKQPPRYHQPIHIMQLGDSLSPTLDNSDTRVLDKGSRQGLRNNILASRDTRLF